jgi:hypothetical protein
MYFLFRRASTPNFRYRPPPISSWADYSGQQLPVSCSSVIHTYSLRRKQRDSRSQLLVQKYASAFLGTPLASILVARGIDTVIVTGCTTRGCVRTTVVDALSYGLRPIIRRRLAIVHKTLAGRVGDFGCFRTAAALAPRSQGSCAVCSPSTGRPAEARTHRMLSSGAPPKRTFVSLCCMFSLPLYCARVIRISVICGR